MERFKAIFFGDTMMAIGKGLCTDDFVIVGAPYLGKLDHNRYLVIVPICPNGTTKARLPYKEAAYIDPLDKKMVLFTDSYPDLAEIY